MSQERMNRRPVVVFVHGGQGCGKSSVTNILREQWTHTVLFRLAGVPSNQMSANEKSKHYHYEMLKAVQNVGAYESGMSFVFDRSYLCEKVYANLGFKAYDFEEETTFLHTEGLKPLVNHYDVYMVLLTATEETLNQRLNRGDKPQFEQVAFEASNSLAQQAEYLKEFKRLPQEVQTIVLPTDGLSARETAQKLMERIPR